MRKRQAWYRIAGALALSLALLGLWLAEKHPVSQAAPTAPDWWTPGNVVINEVAWMGTAAGATHEWLELHNPGHLTVTLTGWRLTTADGMNLALAGQIAPRGYYLIERTEDNRVSDIPADLVIAFGGNGLINNPDSETITLTNALGEPMDTANVGGGLGIPWPAGNNTTKATMERRDPLAADTPGNWADNDGIIRNGLDANGNPIHGTPRALNSAYAALYASRADLELDGVGPTQATVGDTVIYVVSLSNVGGHVAAGTRLTHTLPPGLEFLAQDSAALTFTQAGDVLLWELGNLAPANPQKITVTLWITETAPLGPRTGPFTATTTTPEVYLRNNGVTWALEVLPQTADLGIAKVGPALAAAEELITYTLTLSNNGAYTAAGARVTDTLPVEVAFVAQDSDFDFTQIGQTLVWTGDVLPGAQHRLTVTGQLSPTAVGWLTNHVTATTVTSDVNPANNVAAWTVNVPAQVADVRVSKTGPAGVVASDLITYHLCVANEGILPASGVWLTDTLPAEVAFVAQDSPYTFTASAPTLRWELGDLAPEAATCLTLTGQVTPTALGELTNHITATTATVEEVFANNSAAWTTTVLAPLADLSLEKTGPLTTEADSLITYTLALRNLGGYTAAGARLTDTLPAKVEFVVQESDFAFQQTGQTLVWTGDVLPGAHHLLTVTGRISATAAGLITNRVTVTSITSDVNLMNNVSAWTTQVGEAYVLLSGVYYDSYQDNDTDEAVQLVNAGTAPATLTNWQLCKDVSGSLNCRTLPTIPIDVGQRVWIARSETFSISFGFPPDYVLATWLSGGLSNTGDEVVLRDAGGNFIDTLVYKNGQLPMPGWSGPALWHYSGGREEGQILYRIPDEATGLPIADTDTAADWIQSTHDPLVGRRVLYPGWDLDPLFWPLQATEVATVLVGITPDNAYDVYADLIARAEESIKVEIYGFRHPDMMQAVIAKAQAGVQVTLLLEGSPVGIGENSSDWQTQLWLCQQLENTGNGACWFMINKSTTPRIFSRYRFIHAKLLIVDDTWVAVGTQNFTRTSIPSDDKSNGTYGSRGAVIATNAPAVVARAVEIFALDMGAGAHNDILRWSPSNTGDFYSKYGLPSIAPDLSAWDWVSYTVQFPAPLVISGAFDFELLTSPEATPRQSDGLFGLLNRAGAGDTVYSAQLYEYVAWGDGPNVRLEAYINAARRGARVRLLLNAKSFNEFEPTPPDNVTTVAYVNQIAREERLDLRAGLADTTGLGIHSKIVLVYLHEEGGYAHVGSINGSETSSKLNREIALQVRSDEVYDYLAAAFEYDWWISHPLHLPLVTRNYSPPKPPVDYLVISEVYYATGDVQKQWVEIYNPTNRVIDLSEYKIGDAETPERFEAMYGFPAGALIAPGGVIVVAGRGGSEGVPQAHYELFNLSATPTMIRYVDWGTGEWNLANSGDQVLLLGPDNVPVDVVVWGEAAYPGIVPHPGVENWLHALQRKPAYYDTNDCSFDFRSWYPPSPGHVNDQQP